MSVASQSPSVMRLGDVGDCHFVLHPVTKCNMMIFLCFKPSEVPCHWGDSHWGEVVCNRHCQHMLALLDRLDDVRRRHTRFGGCM